MCFEIFARRAVRIFPALITVVVLTAFMLGPLVSRLPATTYFSHPTTLAYLNNIILYINYSLPGHSRPTSIQAQSMAVSGVFLSKSSCI